MCTHTQPATERRTRNKKTDSEITLRIGGGRNRPEGTTILKRSQNEIFWSAFLFTQENHVTSP